MRNNDSNNLIITEDAGALPPPQSTLGVFGWMKQNLFCPWYNSVYTALSCLILYLFFMPLYRWGIQNASFGPEACDSATTGACWGFIREMWPIFMVGTYPYEQRWRILTALAILVVLAVATLFKRARKWKPLYFLWALSPFVIFILIRGGLGLPHVPSTQWGGLLLTQDVKRIRQIQRDVGMVFQQFNLFPHMTVKNNIMLSPVWVRKIPKSKAAKNALELLDRVGILDQADKYPGQLSGGQQQRVAIARALAMEPKIMLFDEPTSALDPEMIKEVLDVMRELASQGMTMICVTHEMAFAREVADTMIFMEAGKIVENSPSSVFFSNPQEERTRLFLNQILNH